MIVTITADDGTSWARFDVRLPAILPGERGRKVIAAMSATGTAVDSVERETNIIDVLLDAACWEADRTAAAVRSRLRREIQEGNHS